MAVWVVRAAGDPKKELEAIAGSCCIAGWDDIEDFREFLSEPALRDAIRRKYPIKNNMGISGWTRQILRFRDIITSGDIVAMPTGGGSGILHVGLIEGDYEYTPAVEGGIPRHKRAVRWIGTLPKAKVAAEAKGTIGAFLTVFRVEKPMFEKQLRAIVDGGHK